MPSVNTDQNWLSDINDTVMAADNRSSIIDSWFPFNSEALFVAS